MPRPWRIRGRTLGNDLAEERPIVVGILNVTPDSFFDGGRHAGLDAARAHGMRLVHEGADMVDVGGESTRPGASPVDPAEEIHRVAPVVRALVREGAVVSVDTRRPEVARAALDEGAAAVNDVEGLRHPVMLDLCREFDAGACAMHMRGTPGDMQDSPRYGDLYDEVSGFLAAALSRWLEAGLPREGLALDPGVGFGKTFDHNMELVAATARFRDRFRGSPWYLGLSRKSWIAGLPLTQMESDRLGGSLGGALAAARAGCDILRVHDVEATFQAWRAFRACGGCS